MSGGSVVVGSQRMSLKIEQLVVGQGLVNSILTKSFA